MTPGYLTALRQSIRTCAKSAKRPPGAPLIALNTLFAHPEAQRQSTEGIVVSKCDDSASAAEAHQPRTTLGPAKTRKKRKKPSLHANRRFMLWSAGARTSSSPTGGIRRSKDGRRFLADALGWTARELFGLHTPPERPAATYRRLSRYDETGLIWLLRSRPVVALTATTAAIQGATGILTSQAEQARVGPAG